jgi:hypothetical protein
MRKGLALFAAVGLLAAGCGGGGGGSAGGTTTAPTGPPLTKAAYQAKLRQISRDVANSIGKTSSSGNIPKEDVDKLVTAFHTFGDRLADVNPPPAVKGLHARLITTMNELGDEFPGIADKLNKSGKDPSEAIQALFGAKAIQSLIKLGNEFKAKGYNLNLNP